MNECDNKRSHSVVCIGELLIDFYCTDVDVDLMEGRQFLKSAWGAPANVSAAIAKLGGDAAFS
ncbi:PfkB family carbohydrate kinase, partial [Bacillus subtilis]|uniref:PfkB family carbohydrate kinase n=1 Tax=Bacillus subtilis TaxID=1423 RepID=UPI0024AD54EE